MAGKFVISKTSNGKYHFVLKAGNGEVILQSQMYGAVDDAKNGVESVRSNAADASRFQKAMSKKNEPYFTLNATNGQVVGMSEMYSSESARDNGIESVRKNAPDAKVEDKSAEA